MKHPAAEPLEIPCRMTMGGQEKDPVALPNPAAAWVQEHSYDCSLNQVVRWHQTYGHTPSFAAPIKPDNKCTCGHAARRAYAIPRGVVGWVLVDGEIPHRLESREPFVCGRATFDECWRRLRDHDAPYRQAWERLLQKQPCSRCGKTQPEHGSWRREDRGYAHACRDREHPQEGHYPAVPPPDGYYYMVVGVTGPPGQLRDDYELRHETAESLEIAEPLKEIDMDRLRESHKQMLAGRGKTLEELESEVLGTAAILWITTADGKTLRAWEERPCQQ